MRFSIIVPVYKVEAFLTKCIQSIVGQSYSDIEVILVDDGSPDKCPEMCDEWAKKDSRIKVVHKKNGGLSDARNAGLNVATGDFIIFIDSDDYWCENDLLEKISKRYQMFKEDIILFGCKIVKEDGTEEITRSNYDILLMNHHDKSLTLNTLFTQNNLPGSAWIFAVRKCLIDAHNLRFKVGVTSEDFEWIISTLVAANAIGAIEGVQYAYIRRSNSITTHASYSAVKGAENAFKRYEELGKRVPALDKYIARIYLLSLMTYNQLSKEDRLKSAPIFRKHIKTLKSANLNIYYWFVKLLGLKLSSFAIRTVYKTIR